MMVVAMAALAYNMFIRLGLVIVVVIVVIVIVSIRLCCTTSTAVESSGPP